MHAALREMLKARVRNLRRDCSTVSLSSVEVQGIGKSKEDQCCAWLQYRDGLKGGPKVAINFCLAAA